MYDNFVSPSAASSMMRIAISGITMAMVIQRSDFSVLHDIRNPSTQSL